MTYHIIDHLQLSLFTQFVLILLRTIYSKYISQLLELQKSSSSGKPLIAILRYAQNDNERLS